jgi:hypothetical protein
MHKTVYIKSIVIVFAAVSRTTVHSSWLWDSLESFCSLLAVDQQQGFLCSTHVCACMHVCVPGRHEVCCDGVMQGPPHRAMAKYSL